MESKKNMLILTQNTEYGELINRSLSKIVTGNVKIVSTIHLIAKYLDALQETDSSIDFVILDLEVGIEKAKECIFIIRDNNPSVQIIVISKNDPPEEFESLKPWNLLRKPFVENELLDIIRNTINQKKVTVIDGKFLDTYNLQHPIWARDKEKLINIMRDTLVDLDAQEAILISADEIIASTGSLQENDMQNCSIILNKYMDFSGHGELIKQVNLSENVYLMHALVLTVGLIIALLFDPDTSYELIRGQTRHLASKITHPVLPDGDSNSATNPNYKPKIGSSNIIYSTDQVQVKKNLKIKDFEQPNKYLIDNEFIGVDKRQKKINRGDLHLDDHREYLDKPFIAGNTNTEIKRPSIISVGMSQLPFTCLLIPRLESKSISNELVDFLKEKTPLIFLSYGWRLNDILIDKNMMQWIAAIPPIIAPAFQIKTIRKETSKLIFEKFPKISMDGLMKDFWVPGYLVAIGSERISEDEKKELIEENRQRYILDGPNNITTCAQKVIYNNY